jgi:hypothetical protein
MTTADDLKSKAKDIAQSAQILRNEFYAIARTELEGVGLWMDYGNGGSMITDKDVNDRYTNQWPDTLSSCSLEAQFAAKLHNCLEGMIQAITLLGVAFYLLTRDVPKGLEQLQTAKAPLALWIETALQVGQEIEAANLPANSPLLILYKDKDQPLLTSIQEMQKNINNLNIGNEIP